MFTALSPGCAHAQGFFEQLFGGSTPSQTRMVVPPRPALKSSIPSGGSETDGRGGDTASGGTYRTVCVRMCDGYFFPISFATTRKHFQADQAKCLASCGDARLYIYKNPGAGIEDAADLSGRNYSALPTAFAFKKKVVEGCACRPPPWTEAELQRHKAYAAADGGSEPKVAKTQNTLAAAVQADAEKAATPATTVAQIEQTENGKAAGGTKVTLAEPSAAKVRHAARSAQRARGSESVAIKPVQTVSKATGSGVGFAPMGLGGQPKYTWPGDPIGR